jgi:hypothetical protein
MDEEPFVEIQHGKLDCFDDILQEMADLHDRKAADYTNGRDPFSNFRHSAEQVGITPGLACEVLIATKQARLRELLGDGSNKTAQNESVEDTLLDRAVYSIIALDMYRQGLYKPTIFEIGTGD